jgi:osmoprotectant transport system substrate-binding protein
MRTRSWSARSWLARSWLGGPAAGLSLLLVLAACGGDDAFEEGSGSATSEAKGSLVVGSAGFTESQLVAEMYALLLGKAGYQTSIKTVANRELYEPALEKGEIQVVPEYAATMAEFLNRKKNGPDAAPVASADPDATVAAMTTLAEGYGLAVLEPSEANSSNAYAVTKEYAAANNLTTLSDLGGLGRPVVLAATEECPDRPFCQPGLEKTYGIKISKILPLGFGSPQTKDAVKKGTAQLGLVGTTDATLDAFGLVALEDDKKLQAADNLVPVVNAEKAGGAEVEEALNALAPVLTTEDLAELNARVDQERQEAADVAKEYLESKNLL